MSKPVPTSKLARSGVAGTAILKAGSKHLSHAVKRPFLSESASRSSRQRRDDETAQILFKTFSQLRGTALKIAQMLSMESNLLPEWLRNELSKSYHQVPPLGRPLIRKLIEQEFGKSPETVFTHFEPKAFAAASLGQVHSASNASGEALAVKLQYPGIAITIDNDLQLVRSIVKRTRYAKLLLSSLDEIAVRLHEEVDYQHEAENTEWFQQHLKLYNIIIPHVHRDLSSKRILTTTRLPGRHLEQWLQQGPTQKERNHFGQLLYDLFVNSFYGLHALHADPNPGNYLFNKNGRLGLVDFGCVRFYSTEFVTLIPKLLHAYRSRDAQAVITTYQKLGMVTDMSESELQSFYEKTLQPFGDWLTKPFKAGSFDFSSRSASYTEEGWASFKQLANVKKINDLANEFIYFDRTFFGLYQIFERIGATINMEHPWLD
ncbi:MAG: AarF/ABC1/UbiB kinase family protein [Candidatus Thiodiazotropha sp. (ex Lucinoma kastoroae)]|nr:AarF/ABC1/UbiB kinase family protein [Candidatus Thiodiazotropha sp. (ex Lucinoma kastoroae)]MCU7860693.1 AarF/ABC1/UbiB kinase family protein [Candidatus Thiodiazotropha sp. (ex Lucinoma kastoroae)]